MSRADSFDFRSVELLDCTLRDGSYTIDYQFTLDDTRLIAAALETAGLRLIEIGHGLGFRASETGKGRAAFSDIEYIEAVVPLLNQARAGMFFIPGIAELEDVATAVSAGLGFLRVGTNSTESQLALPPIEAACRGDLLVWANLMKSYAIAPREFGQITRKLYQAGAHVVCLVDSAGGMVPDEIRQYIESAKQACPEARLGFHGHNNLQLAVANSVAAIKAGASVIDVSILGMGRSAGNTQTEVMAAVMQKLGVAADLDLTRLLHIGSNLVYPRMRQLQGIDEIGVVSGLANFHSGFLPVVRQAAQKFDVELSRLIIRLGNIETINVTAALADDVAEKLSMEQKKSLPRPLPAELSRLKDTEQPVRQEAKQVAAEAYARSRKQGVKMVFVLAAPHRSRATSRFPFIRNSPAAVIGLAEAANDTDAQAIVETVDGIADLILVDRNLPCRDQLLAEARTSHLSLYDDRLLLLTALEARIDQRRESSDKVALLFDDHWYSLMGRSMCDKDSTFTRLTHESLPAEPLTLVVCGQEPLTLTESVRGQLSSHQSLVIDVIGGSLSDESIGALHAVKVRVERLDVRAALSGLVSTHLETEDICHHVLGRGRVGGVEVVAGGLLGRKGEVIVDRIDRPTEIIGVANGRGGLLEGEALADHLPQMEQVKRELIEGNAVVTKTE
jgi:4-hydroxy-2-oxovalerate aldolase